MLWTVSAAKLYDGPLVSRQLVVDAGATLPAMPPNPIPPIDTFINSVAESVVLHNGIPLLFETSLVNRYSVACVPPKISLDLVDDELFKGSLTGVTRRCAQNPPKRNLAFEHWI